MDPWFRPENCIGDCNDAGVLAAQTTDCDRIGLTCIHLKVNQAHWKDKHVALLKDLSKEAAIGVGGDKSNVEGAFDDGQDLGRSWVCVGRVQAIGGIVNADQRDAKGVEPGHLGHVHRGHP